MTPARKLGSSEALQLTPKDPTVGRRFIAFDPKRLKPRILSRVALGKSEDSLLSGLSYATGCASSNNACCLLDRVQTCN